MEQLEGVNNGNGQSYGYAVYRTVVDLGGGRESDIFLTFHLINDFMLQSVVMEMLMLTVKYRVRHQL